MSRPIKEGDIVTVWWADEGNLKNAIVLNTPSDVGDLWYFEAEDKIWAVNPISSNFDCIVKETK